MSFSAVSSQRLYQQVADQVAGLIRSGNLNSGMRLPPERDLAKQLGVSRPTLREALIALEIAGLVEVRMGSGVYVLAGSSSRSPVLDAGCGPFEILTARKAVEGETAALAALNRNPSSMSRIDKAWHAHKAAVQNKQFGYSEDRNFHLAIAQACANPLLLAIVEGLWEHMGAPMTDRLGQLSQFPTKIRTNIADHLLVKDRIAAGDVEGARAAMHEHITHVEGFFMDDNIASDDRKGQRIKPKQKGEKHEIF